ncbi:MAG TPA: hypothetical protein VKT78_02035 [Fimbriimonadaceae bacterium]|nr:hypothetical protein [Fimbriimonadaceae bacterium]
MIGEDFASEYQRICRLINDADIGREERKKAFDAIWGIRRLLEQEEINPETARAMASKLATAIRFAASPPIDAA